MLTPFLTLVALLFVLGYTVRGARPANGRRHAHRLSTLRSYHASNGLLLALPAGWAVANVGARVGESANGAMALAIAAGVVAARRSDWVEAVFGPIATVLALQVAFRSGAMSTPDRLALVGSIALAAVVAFFGLSLRSHRYAHAARVATIAFCVTDLMVFMRDPAGATVTPWRGVSALALAIPICALAGYASSLVVPMISIAVMTGDIALALAVPRPDRSTALLAFAMFAGSVVVSRSLLPSPDRSTRRGRTSAART